jgi:Dienelactone hydrolase family
MRKALFAMEVILLLSLCSCGTYQFSGTMKAQLPSVAKEAIPLFEYENPPDMNIRFHGKTEKKKNYTIREIKWTAKDFAIMKHKHMKGYFYEPVDQSKKRPALVVLPPTGGPYEIVKDFAKYFADRGFVVLALRRREAFFNPEKSEDYNAKLFRQAVIDARRSLDYLEALDYVDKDQLCVMGVSLGGIITGLTMEMDTRVKAAGLVVTAGHLPDILKTSGYRTVGAYRNGLVKQAGLKRSELYDYSKSFLRPYDPVTYADRLDPARIIMINGAMDDIIRREVVMKTWKSYGRPQLHFVAGGHYTTIGFPKRANKKIFRHFINILNLNPDDIAWK